MRRDALLLVTLLASAGCLADPADPDVSVGENILLEEPPLEILPPTPVPVTPPTEALPGARILRHEAGDGERATFEVAADMTLLSVRATSSATWRGALLLVAPDLDVAGSCDGAACALSVEAPQAGTWTIVLPPEAPQDLVVEAYARAKDALPPTPVDQTQHQLYAREKRFDDVFYVAIHNDTVALPLDYDRFVVKVLASAPAAAPGVAMTRVFDPAGVVRGECDAAVERCVVEIPQPAAGLWRIQYAGEAQAAVQVTAYGLDAQPRGWPANMTAFQSDHRWPVGGANRTAGFYVADGGYARILLSTAFRDASGGNGVPFIQLRAPNGTVMARCDAKGPACPSEVAASVGVWRVDYLSTAGGAVRIDARLDPSPAAPPPGPAPTTLSEPELVLLESYAFHGRPNQTAWLNLFSGTRLTGNVTIDVVPDARGWEPSFVLYEPGFATQRARCTASCEIDLQVGASGRWWMAVDGSGNGTISVALTMREEVPGAFVRGGDGRHFDAYNASHSYDTWLDRRGDFSEAVHIPGNWTQIAWDLDFVPVGADDPGATARIEIIDPFGKVVHACARPQRSCDADVAATRGTWRVRYLGVDASSVGRVVADVR